MNFLSPWWLLGLPIVAIVAMLTIRRQDRRLVVVSSVKLWLTVGEGCEKTGDKNRRITASWVCLLLGAAVGVIALAGPVWQSAGPVRHIRLELLPSAELASPASIKKLQNAAWVLLDGLDSQDRVQIVLPTSTGGTTDWLTLTEARNELQTISPLPVRAASLTFPPIDSTAQHTYRIGPAGAGQANGPRVTQIEIPTDLPAISFDAIAAKLQPDGMVQIFIAVRNGSSKIWRSDVLITPLDANENDFVIIPTPIEPGETVTVIQSVQAADGYRVSAGELQAWLARQNSQRVKVVMLGRDEPTLRRYIQADSLLELWAKPDDADVVIANGVEPPAGLASLIINPPKSPPGWRAADVIKNIVLDQADITADDEILENVVLVGLAIRRARPWFVYQDSTPSGVPIISIAGQTLLLRTDPDSLALPIPRRVYTAFDISAENTNIETEQALVVLLANVFRWLANSDSANATMTYSYQTPIQTVGEAGWAIVEGGKPDWIKKEVSPGLLKWPGLYRDEAGQFRAVNLIGLASAKPAKSAEQTIADVKFPEPVESNTAWPIWRGVIIMMMIFWLVGWVLRVR